MTENTLGTWLKRRIEDFGETQAAFAARAGIPFHSLRAWISGRHTRMQGRNCAMLARALGISREELEQHLQPFEVAA